MDGSIAFRDEQGSPSLLTALYSENFILYIYTESHIIKSFKEYIRSTVFLQLYISRAHVLLKSMSSCSAFSAHNWFTYELLQLILHSWDGILALTKVAIQATIRTIFGLIKKSTCWHSQRKAYLRHKGRIASFFKSCTI